MNPNFETLAKKGWEAGRPRVEKLRSLRSQPTARISGSKVATRQTSTSFRHHFYRSKHVRYVRSSFCLGSIHPFFAGISHSQPDQLSTLSDRSLDDVRLQDGSHLRQGPLLCLRPCLLRYHCHRSPAKREFFSSGLGWPACVAKCVPSKQLLAK